MPRTLGAAAILGLLLALTPMGAWAAPENAPAVAPVITAPTEGAFINSNTTTVRGTGSEAGNEVSVAADGPACTTTVGESLAWECRVQIGNGAGRAITATETTADGPVASSVTVDVLGAPTIDQASPTAGPVTGTAYPGARVQVRLSSSAGGCVATATTTNYWSCTPTTSAGGRVPTATYQVTAQQSHNAIGSAGDVSSPASRSIAFDTTAPAPPVIVTPAGDYRLLSLPTTFAGTGEPGGSVDVYLDGIPVCSARVDGSGAWSCIGGSTLSNAAHEVRAIQIDGAGNHSAPSASIRVFFGPATSPSRPQAPSPTPTPSPTPSPTPTPEDTPVPSSPRPSEPGPTGFPTLPSLSGDAGADALTNWGSPTTFGDGLPTIKESYERGNWWRAGLLAIGAIVLVAMPARLLATSLRGRLPWHHSKFTGRNRPTASDDHTIGLSPWLSAAIPFVVTVAFMVIAGGVKGEVRYLRLAVAVAIALGVLNLVGVTIAARFGHLWQGVDGRVRFRPMLLVAAIASGLLSRIIGLTPPLVTGTLIGIRMPHETPVRGRAIVNLLQVGTVLVLGVIGWVGHSRLGDVVGFWPSLMSELFAALCLVGVGSVLALMLPIGALPGRVVWEWHRWLWFVLAFAFGTIAFAVLLGGASAKLPLAVLILLAGGFAAACIAGWAWVRFVAQDRGAR
jgi:hypothetical protein